ncbi:MULTISPECIES: hypothetical protein [Vagococcus]|uniref:Uncharacterized protein n=1 Tax=Vagococcus fluvialis bH819 TaxID=1255619 RepID=A0A1X6WM89_9ENTE|nr:MULTISPECIES: hypothetical protein [Vagococcus]SLM85390.1 hypothetical protein FM121_04780 [Vagococcus fluvialis bH819]
MNIYGVRRYGVLLVVFVLGMILGSLDGKLIAILGIPMFMMFLFNLDIASFQLKKKRGN